MCSLQLYLSAAERWRTCLHCTCNWFTLLTFAKLNTLLQLSISFSFLPIFFAFRPGVFLDAQASLAPTHVSPSVRPLVRHTFGFPIGQRLWSPYVKS